MILRVTLFLLFCSIGAMAADNQKVRVLDVRPFTEASHAPPQIAPNNGHPVLITHGVSEGFTLTVQIEDEAYSAKFYNRRHFKSADITVGDVIPAKLGEHKHREALFIQMPDGKEAWGFVDRKERLQN